VDLVIPKISGMGVREHCCGVCCGRCESADRTLLHEICAEAIQKGCLRLFGEAPRSAETARAGTLANQKNWRLKPLAPVTFTV